MKLYLIPGLGADSRMYDELIQAYPDSEVLEWFVPLPQETFNEYVQRFSKQIKCTTPYSILGTSMGGIIAIELSKICNAEHVIIVSSVKTRNELPHFIRIGKYIPLLRSTTGKFYNTINRNLVKLLKLRSERKFLQLAIEMSKDADPEFMTWAVEQVMQWNNTSYPNHVTHIHGTRDTLFPIFYIKNCIRINGGTHLMMMERNSEIIPIILDTIQKDT